MMITHGLCEKMIGDFTMYRIIKFKGKCISPKLEDKYLYLKWVYGPLKKRRR